MANSKGRFASTLRTSGQNHHHWQELKIMVSPSNSRKLFMIKSLLWHFWKKKLYPIVYFPFHASCSHSWDNRSHSFLSSCCDSVTKSWLFCDTPLTVARQAPLSMGFSGQEYWSGLPFPPPGDLPDPGIKPSSPALAGRFFTTEPSRKGYKFFSWPQDCSLSSLC